MQPAPSQIVPFLLAALVMWSIYRRLRRSFGRQRLRPVQMGIRIGLFVRARPIACARQGSAHGRRRHEHRVCYYGVVLWKSKHLTAEELAVEPAPLPQ